MQYPLKRRLSPSSTSLKLLRALHDVFVVCLGVAMMVYVVGVPLLPLLQGAKGAIAPVALRPKVAAAVLPALQPVGTGMAFGDTLRLLTQAELDKQLQDVAHLGFTWVRMDIDWSAVQPLNASTYSWEAYDRVIHAARVHDLHVLATIAYAPKWARQSACADSAQCAPQSNAMYADFARKAVARYSPQGVETWEVWNEPNIKNFWQPTPQPQQYTAMLRAAYTAIKGVDAHAIVLSAGLSPAEDQAPDIAPRTFLSAMYAAGAGGYFDALGYHPYSYPAPPDVVYSWSGWSQMADLSRSLRTIMQANGDGNKSIWMTEVGVPTGGNGVTATPANFRYYLDTDHSDEQLQAIVATQAVDAVKNNAWAGPMFWYSYKDLGTSSESNENFFGILRADGTRKPAYNTFQQLLKK